MTECTVSYQTQFEHKWHALTHPHVRALAWLLDAPDLLDPVSPQWAGQIASLGPLTQLDADWLHALQRDPAELELALAARVYSRLGLYAEKLLAFYFEQRGVLVAHGVPVRANKNDTVGEFDFLLRRGADLLHWEFASKFYLLDDSVDRAGLHGLIGPNLADTLGLKMHKILVRQLALGRHPAAQIHLPQALMQARALVKGWLFYPGGVVQALAGIGATHQHGFWLPLADLNALAGERFVVLPRLQWLAPLKARLDVQVYSRVALQAALTLHFSATSAPVLVATVSEHDGWLLEQERGFIVPDDWLSRAAERRLSGLLPGAT